VVRVSRRRLAALAALVLASGFCLALVGVRMRYSGSDYHRFLLWNLFLAWIPFVLALALYDRHQRGRSRLQLGTLAALWLLFLPNAPYVLTDLVHLHESSRVPLWYDAIMFAACAWTALALGIGSLLLVHQVARRRIGERLSWALLLPVLSLVSLGIYLGRFVRLNSWDALTRPGHVAHVIATPLSDPLGHPRFLVVTTLFTLFLILTYLVVYTVAELRLEPEDQAATRRRRRV
jgi:uncharacterized membrane protein